MKVTINNNEITLKTTFRSYIIFENITGKSFTTMASFSDVLVFMYSVILGSSKSTEITFDEFLDYIDANPDMVTKFTEWMSGTNEVVNNASNNSVLDDDSKKKTTHKPKLD